MAICSVGRRHTWTSTSSSITKEVLDRHHWLLHKVDRSRTFCQDHKKNTRHFLWKSIIYQFRIPKIIFWDNAKQFDNDGVKKICSDLAISHHFSLFGHPQVNGHVEVTNRTILRNVKTRLEKSKGEWVEDLPSILWAYHTTSRILTSEIPFSMVYK